MCDHHYDNDPTAQKCTRTDPHDPDRAWGGHEYRPASGLSAETGDDQ